MNRISHPAINHRFKHSTRKFSTAMLKINACESVVTSNWTAVLLAKDLVLAFDGVKARWKTALVLSHRANLAKHTRKRAVHLGLSDERPIPAHSFRSASV